MNLKITLRGKNAASSAAAAMVALLSMSLWNGGAEGVAGIVRDLMPLFLLISFIALVLGAFLSTPRIRWSFLIGALSGIAGGTAIVIRVFLSI